MAGPTVIGEVREDNLLAGYVFFGEETYLADEFVDQLAKTLASSSAGEFHLTRFELGESRWPEIIDAARTAPFLFEPWRVLVVRFPERKAGAERGWGKKGPGSDDEARGPRHLSVGDQAILRDYFAAPPARTVLVIILTGRLKKSDAAVRFFSSLPKSAAAVAEVKPLKEPALMRRAAEKARALGKTLTESAATRLCAIVGSDLRLLMNEVEKLALFVGERKGIETEDVDQATAWQRSFETYELDDALTAADLEKAVAVLNVLLTEGERPEQLVARLAGHLRTILSAQTRLRERSMSREEIFRETYPYIQKSYGFYREKYDAFFGAVDGLSPTHLDILLGKLRRVDQLLKTTDAKPQALLEAFLWEYCAARKRKSLISEGSI